MKVYLLYELSGDGVYVMSVWSTRKKAEEEAKRLVWRACDGYEVREMVVR